MYTMDTDGRKHPVEKRPARRAFARKSGLPFQPIHGSRKPFKRAVALTNALAEVAKIENPAQRRLAVAALPVLRSRGHGGRHPQRQRSVLGRAMQDRSAYSPAAEDRRRVRG